MKSFKIIECLLSINCGCDYHSYESTLEKQELHLWNENGTFIDFCFLDNGIKVVRASGLTGDQTILFKYSDFKDPKILANHIAEFTRDYFDKFWKDVKNG